MSGLTRDFVLRWVLGEPDESRLPGRGTLEEMYERARAVRENAWVPVSSFKVGGALLTGSGRVFAGANVEASNCVAICAERSALVAAVAEGERDVVAVWAIADTEAPITPCGQCRQTLADFAPEALVFMSSLRSNVVDVAVLSDLFPRSDFRTGEATPVTVHGPGFEG